MTPFAQLAPIGRGAFQAAALLLCFLALYALIDAAALRLGARWMGGCAALFVAACLLQQGAYDIAWRWEAGIPSRPALIPAAALLVALAALSLFTAFLIPRLYQLRRMRISPLSVKEGIEHLSTGLCFCEENGLTLLMNRKMNDLCHAMTGGALLDAKAFWETLLGGFVQGGAAKLQGGPLPMWRLADGAVVSFERSELTLHNKRIFQITATDVTEQYRLHMRLQEENRRLREMNGRLRRYGETVREVTREGEILAAKVRLHDELGRISLVARRAMRPCAVQGERAALLEHWRRSIALIHPEADAQPRATGLERLAEAAKAIGVSVQFQGVLPPAGTGTARLMEAALRECLTNTVRHGEGTRLYVELHEGAQWTATLTNNGRIPDGPILEGIGLGSLRANIQHAGGTMRVEHAPRFALTISLPKESEGFA